MIARYLRSRALGAAVWMLFALVFALVFFLCGLPLDAVGYAALICAVLGLGVVAVDWARFARRWNLLERLRAHPEDAADALPAPRNEIEGQYQALLRQLRAAQLAAEAERREKYAVMCDVYTLWAHQIKTPIAAMRLILQDMSAPEGAELRCELERVEQYVEMVLCYVRLDSEVSDYLIRRCDLDAIVRRELRAASSRFIRGRIALGYEGVGCAALTDEKWLGFVIGQILSNALKYTPPGGRIDVYMESEGVLCIRDSGVGIPPEDLPRVTESGFTGRNGRMDANSRRATGLGLYLCRRILERLGHGFEIESRRGEGTLVRLDLRASRLELE